MRTRNSLCLIAIAALVAVPALAKKPNSSPAVVVISVDGDGTCQIINKVVTIFSRETPAGVRGPRKVRFFYARGEGDASRVKILPNAAQKYPTMLTLPQLGEAQSMGDSSESNEAFDGEEYRFQYSVEIHTEDETVICDPDIVIKKGS